MSENQRLTVIILAAGKGTRMRSPLPKVLHPVAGKAMLERIIRSCQAAGAADIRVVVGEGQNLVRKLVEPLGVHCYLQSRQQGTADAVRAAQPEGIEGDILILNGDHPLIESEDIERFLKEFRSSQADLAVVTTTLKQPGSLGRIVRSGGHIQAIVEAKDASHETRKIKEINTGIYMVTGDTLSEYLPQIDSHNANQEYYLTDLVSLSLRAGLRVRTIDGSARVAHGVNTQSELARASRYAFKKKARALMDEGVLILDPAQTYIEEDVQVGPGSVIYPGVYLKGKTKIGSFCVFEPHCFIFNSEIGDGVQVRAGSYLESSRVAAKATLGPYARLRPGTEIGEEAQIGNFVELKNVEFGKGAKAAHLAYLGDAQIGEGTNIGCGTITCNYAADRKKYRTRIGSHVFVGSDSQFIAPVEVGDHAVIGSGSTITKDVPAGALAVARGRQIIKENYQPKSPSEETEKDS